VIHFILDTNICIVLLRNRAPGLLERMRKHAINQIGISSITFAELQDGIAKSARREQHEQTLIRFCAPLAIWPFDDQAAETYGQVRAALEREGKPIGPMDTLIAAHALSLGHILVTDNTREFKRVDGLRIENWMKE
jgi:tRNA(fMet)-specific endonuclease VapC